MNTSLLKEWTFNDTIADSFWWSFPSILADGTVSTSVSPTKCSGDSCSAYFFPGPLKLVKFDPSVPAITPSDFPNAKAYIQKDAPGFQVDFYPLEQSDPPMTLADCRIYGLSFITLQLCLKSVDSSILAGSPCR